MVAVPQPAFDPVQFPTIREEDWPEILAELAQESCAFFASQYLQGPPEAPYNGRFLIGEHHEEWSDAVAEHARLCVLAPRDHGKSFFFNMAYPIWQAQKHPNRKGYVFSGSQPQAEEILADIALEIETNPLLKHLNPSVKTGRWSSTRIVLANGHKIYARGYGTKVRGAHPIWIVCDDVLNDDSMYSDLVRRKSIEYFYSAITNMIVPGGQIIVVGTPFHQQDLYGDLSRNNEYEFKRYRALSEEKDEEGARILGPDGKPIERALWPERYPVPALHARRREIGQTRFSREQLCQPVSDDASLFPLNYFRGEPVEQFHFKLGSPAKWWDQMGITQRFMGVDFAISTNVGADYTVIWVMGLDKVGNRWVIDIIRDKGLPFETQKSLIRNAALKYDPQLIFLESNQMQRIFHDDLLRTTDLPIRPVHTGENKHHLEKGMPSLRVLLENQKLRIPRGDDYSRDMTDIWIDEMRNHTFQGGRVVSVGEHDDCAMAFYICEQALRQGTFGFSFREEEGDDEAYREVMTGLPAPGVEWEEDDEFYDEAELDPNFVLGAETQRGRPRKVNAGLVEEGETRDEDYAMQKREVERAAQRRRRRGPAGKSYQEVRPPDGSPTAMDFLSLGNWRT